MPGFDHRPAPQAERDDEQSARRRARYGLVLFAVYLALYAGFMYLNAFRPGLMDTTVAGVNVAVLYGFGLIAAAFGLALVYAWLCRAASPPPGPESGEGAP
jgi:uncharacterized membrane protein (DUF485 family)